MFLHILNDFYKRILPLCYTCLIQKLHITYNKQKFFCTRKRNIQPLFIGNKINLATFSLPLALFAIFAFRGAHTIINDNIPITALKAIHRANI